MQPSLSNSLYPSGSRLQQHTDGSAKPNAQGHGGAAGLVDSYTYDYPHTNRNLHTHTYGNANGNTDTDNYTVPCS